MAEYDEHAIEDLAKSLFERENKDPSLRWDAVTTRSQIGADVIAGAGEEIRERYRQRIRDGER